MSYTQSPTKDYYVDAYWLLKDVVEKISAGLTCPHEEAALVLEKLKNMREKEEQ
jgi:Ni2+-binding GTPase involved in maturation of urease and hydrogenase